MIERRQQLLGCAGGNPAPRKLARNAVPADLIQLVDGNERRIVEVGRNAERLQHPFQQPTMVHANDEIAEPELAQHITDRRADLCLDNRRRRPDRVDVALVELAKPPSRGSIRPPHRLNLISLEELRKLPPMFRDDARERDGEVVPKREIGLARRLVLTSPQHLEYELVAFLAVLTGERLDILERRRLERFEPVSPVGPLDDADNVLAPPHVVGKEIAHPARGTCLVGHQLREL